MLIYQRVKLSANIAGDQPPSLTGLLRLDAKSHDRSREASAGPHGQPGCGAWSPTVVIAHISWLWLAMVKEPLLTEMHHQEGY